MPILVMKFGGTSVANLERIEAAALKVKNEVDKGYQTVLLIWCVALHRCMTRVNMTRSLLLASRYLRDLWR
jgi:aspartokinase